MKSNGWFLRLTLQYLDDVASSENSDDKKEVLISLHASAIWEAEQKASILIAQIKRAIQMRDGNFFRLNCSDIDLERGCIILNMHICYVKKLDVLQLIIAGSI